MKIRENLRSFASTIVSLVLMSSLASAAAPPAPPATTKTVVPQNDCESGTYSGIQQEKTVVITDQASWAALWTKHTANQFPPSAAPKIDFNNDMIIAVWTDERPSSGYSVKISKIEDDGKTLTVTWEEKTRSQTGGVLAVMTQPFAMVRVKKSGKPVTFVKTYAPSVVDLGKRLPSRIYLTQGQTVVFSNGLAKFSATDTDGKGAILDSQPVPGAMGAFTATRVGTGSITVTWTPQGTTYTMAVHVTAKP